MLSDRRRLKIWGRAMYVEDDSELIESLKLPNYEAEVERVILFHIEAWNWNCPQHIPIRYSEQEVAALQARITELEELLAKKQQI